MSGGVDSAVSAALLKEQGHEVIGLFMKNWEEEDEFGVCQASKEYKDVQLVCEKLGIAHYSVDFVKEYQERVFNEFIEEYKLGRTPNPDVLCNREIKFKVFFDQAMALGADYLATGHYCQRGGDPKLPYLLKGKDPSKDQSYFLNSVKAETLRKVIFPIGHLEKSEVRKLALKFELSVAEKKDSTGICFIGERKFLPFISQFINLRPGPLVTLEGEVVGEHSGSAYYTLGQRKGLGLGGPGRPWFVVDKDISKNEVVVARGSEHPALFSYDLHVGPFHFIHPALEDIETLPLFGKIRYRQNDQSIKKVQTSDEESYISFHTPQRAITPGQSLVLYKNCSDGDVICLGGATIERSGKSLHTLNG